MTVDEAAIVRQAQAFRGCPVGDIVAAGALKEAMRIIEVATHAQADARKAMRTLKAKAGGLAKARAKRHN